VLAGRTFPLARTIMLGPDSLHETLVIESFSLERHDLVVALLCALHGRRADKAFSREGGQPGLNRPRSSADH
jgi:hypothetical protein